MISGALYTLVSDLFYLSRVLSLLRTLAIAEYMYGMVDSIEGTVKEGNGSIGFVYLVYVSVQLGLDGCGVGSSAVLAQRRSGR